MLYLRLIVATWATLVFVCAAVGEGGQLESSCLDFSNLLFTQRLDPIQFSLVTGQFAHIPVGSNPIE